MKRLVYLLVLLMCCANVHAQFTLRLTVTTVATKSQDDIYVAGSFNNWNPRDDKYKLKPFGTSRRGIVLNNLAPGKYEFKFTRGIDKWETTAKGEDIPNRVVELNDDVNGEYTVAGWKDDFPDKPKPNTASKQVSIIDTAFNMPELGRKRRIWLYLPKSYKTSGKRYPVLYMHDGQNLFNEQTAPFGEWGVDEAMDSLAKEGLEAIIVGIDHGGDKRLTEYNPYDHPKFGKGEGVAYLNFIVNTLKPYIDKQYRTQADSLHTFIAGSSMGGLISMYAVAQYPGVFGGAGIFSPAFEQAPAIFDDLGKARWGAGMRRFFFYAGGKESNYMVPDMDKALKIVETGHNYKTLRIVNPIGKHNEAAWRTELAEFIRFLLR